MDNTSFAEIVFKGDFAVLKLKGRINIHEASCIQGVFDEQLEKKKNRFIINLSEVNYISSSFIGILAAYKKKAEDRGGIFEICEPNSFIIKILTVTNLISILHPYGSDEEIIKKHSASQTPVV